MANFISTERMLAKLDELLSRNDYTSAEKHILYWLSEADSANDKRCKLLLTNELAGLYRKLSREEDALNTVQNALELIKDMGIENNIGAGTTYINCATVLKAFGKAEDSMPLFEKALNVYKEKLESNDKRFGGLYNNMALSLVDLKRFDDAYKLYEKAISIMEQHDDGMLEVAITYLNIASAKEAELGLETSEKIIEEYLNKAMKILDEHKNRDGYYAFVCDKCASVFGYYGFFVYQNDLIKRAREIYERS